MVFNRKNREQTVAVLFLVPFLIGAFYGFLPQTLVHADSTADNWPMYHHDAAHTGYSGSSAPVTAAQLWNYTIDTGALSAPSSPAVVDGYVYVGSGDQNIYCFDADTGANVWSYPTGDYASSTPAVVDGRVYAGSADGYFYGLDALSGEKLWAFSVRQPDQSRGSAESSPTVVGDRVYVESGAGDVFCINAADGSLVWDFSTGADASNPSPAVDGSYVYVGNSEGGVFCLGAADGAKIWNFTVGGAVHSPTVANGYVYLGSADGNVYCLRASDGAKVWNYTTEYNSNGPSHNYHWGNTVSDPAVSDGKMYVGSSDFLVFCLDAASGSPIWNYTTNAEVYAAPTVASGYVFAGSYDGNLYCFNASDGSEIWSFPAGVFSPVNAGGSASSPAIAEGVVYVVGNGIVYALGAQSASSVSFSIVVIAVVVVLAVVAAAALLLKRKICTVVSPLRRVLGFRMRSAQLQASLGGYALT
jgi:eukaryotic-like serine/threonine-protein kinase